MNRRKKKNTRANLYRGGDGKSYYEANKRRRMSRYIKVGSTILITLLLALSIMKISGRGIFAQRAYSELSDEVLSAQKPTGFQTPCNTVHCKLLKAISETD